jgi:hypothetical protein
MTPQASDELRAMWEDDNAALTYLERRGIKEIANGLLRIPRGFVMNNQDAAAIQYLLDEWDFDYARQY